jgi:NADPH:quinone reductase-like Zn-dependent oxidoreductase
MQAARVHKPGPPEVIVVESIDVPEPGQQEILVRVRAAGVGPWDALVRTDNSGLPQTYPLILGAEISGIVEKVGPGAGDFVAGDEVFGACPSRKSYPRVAMMQSGQDWCGDDGPRSLDGSS